MTSNPLPVTRRGALRGAGVAVAGSLAGCLSDVLGDANPASYTDWLGPAMALADGEDGSQPDIEEFSASTPETFASGPFPGDLVDVATPTDVFDGDGDGGPVTLERGETDTVLSVAPGDDVFVRVFLGTYDPEDVVASLPADAAQDESHRGVDLYAWETDESGSPWTAVGVGSEAVLTAEWGGDRTGPTSTIRGALDVAEGEAPTYVDEDDAFASFVDAAGEGFFVSGGPLGRVPLAGTRVRLDGDWVDRRGVFVATDEDEARSTVDRIEEDVETRSEPAEETDRRGLSDQYAVYEDVEIDREGRVVRFDARIPAAELLAIDL